MQKASPARTGNMKKQFELIPVLMVKLSLNPHTKPYPIQKLIFFKPLKSIELCMLFLLPSGLHHQRSICHPSVICIYLPTSID